MQNAIFRALLRDDGNMLAALAIISGERARFFIVQKRESQEEFVGRVSRWIKEQGGTGLDMQPPDIIPKGAEIGEVMMRLRAALGAGRDDADKDEFDVQNSNIVMSDALNEPKN